MNNKTLTEGNILSTLMKFAIPVFLALFLQAMYGAVDLLVVGKFAEIADQSGVATGSMFTHTFGNVTTCFAMGVTVLISEGIGSKNKEKVSKGIGTSVIFFAIVSVICTVMLVLLAPYIARLMHSPEDALKQTTSYIRICGAGIIFIIYYNLIGAIFRGIGDSKTPLITVAIACAINIIADLIFIIVFHMGASGAALATVLAQAISVLISLVIILKKKDIGIKIEKKDFRIDNAYLKKMLLIGIPVALQELLVGFSFLFIQSTVNAISLVASAAVGVGEKVCAFLMLVSSSFMQAMAAFVAQNNAANKKERSKKALLYGILTGLACGLVTGAVSLFAGNYLAMIFSKESEVINIAYTYLKAYSIDCLLTAILFCFIGYFNGCEKTIFVMSQGIVGAFFVRVPLVFLFSKISTDSLFLIGLATPISSAVQITMCLIAFMIYNKKDRIKLATID